jgi:hypothetical protein
MQQAKLAVKMPNLILTPEQTADVIAYIPVAILAELTSGTRSRSFRRRPAAFSPREDKEVASGLPINLN